MNHYITGATIKALREKKGYTQKQLAERLAVSDKTISKWETQKGLPDISLLEPLANHLSVSLAELLSGECIINRNRCGNIKRAKFYVCPICGNVIYSLGEGAFSCCGIALPPLEAEDVDESHHIQCEKVENDYFITLEHPMTKSHYLSFIAYVSMDQIQFKKLYSEQNPEARFPLHGCGTLYFYCNQHGLFRKTI